MDRVSIGMKRVTIAKLRDELTKALNSGSDYISVEMYGDVDPYGCVLTITNDDMERDEVPDDAIYPEAE